MRATQRDYTRLLSAGYELAGTGEYAQEIGEGSYGQVYLAKCLETGAQVGLMDTRSDAAQLAMLWLFLSDTSALLAGRCQEVPDER